MAGEEVQPGFVFLVAADGSVRQVADGIAFPNGMAVTADNSTLIVADSYRHNLVTSTSAPAVCCPACLGRPRRGHSGRHLRRRRERHLVCR